MSGRPSLRTRKRDSGTARRLHYFGTGGQLVGVGARVSRARAPDGWRRSVRSGEPARHEQGSAGGSASSASQGSLTRAFPSHGYEIDQD